MARGGRNTQISRKLSWLLRHGATAEHLALSPTGDANLAHVLANRHLRALHVTPAEVLAVVAENDKQRFALRRRASYPDAHASDADAAAVPAIDDPSRWTIRATQGHSLALAAGPSALTTPISAANAPALAVHGTTRAAWPRIRASGGLRPMGRTHVHFASGLPAGFSGGAKAATAATAATTAVAAPAVVSGMRTSSTVLMFLDVGRALAAGLPLGWSANGVVLSEGDASGIVPLGLFRRVEDRTRDRVLVEDGRLVDGDEGAGTGTGTAAAAAAEKDA